MAAKQTLKLETVNVADLVPMDANARTHDERNVAAIVASLQEHGQVEPLVVQAGTNKVVAGHGRLLAMQQLGWKKCRIVRVDVTDAEATALALRLNRTADLAEWDVGVLMQQLDALAKEGVSADSLGWSTDDLDSVMSVAAVPDVPPSDDQIDQDAPKQGRPINMTVEQRQVFDQAVAKLREQEQQELTEGRCVELMAADWISGN